MVGTTISSYKILAKLGAGGMGEVYLANDTRLHRKVALKLLPPETAADAEANARLLREATAAAREDGRAKPRGTPRGLAPLLRTGSEPRADPERVARLRAVLDLRGRDEGAPRVGHPDIADRRAGGRALQIDVREPFRRD
jgi:hypothetical protein